MINQTTIEPESYMAIYVRNLVLKEAKTIWYNDPDNSLMLPLKYREIGERCWILSSFIYIDEIGRLWVDPDAPTDIIDGPLITRVTKTLEGVLVDISSWNIYMMDKPLTKEDVKGLYPVKLVD